MNRRSAICATATVALLLAAMPSPAHACQEGNETRELPYWPSRAVDVLVNVSDDCLDESMVGTLCGVQQLFGVTPAAVIRSVRQALTMYNEDGGAHFRLRYAGTTEEFERDGAIIVFADVLEPLSNNSGYWSKINVEGSDPPVRRFGRIHIYQTDSVGFPRTWREASIFHIVMAELAHAIGRFHTNEVPRQCGEAFPENWGHQAGSSSYTFPRYDKVWHQKINGTRTGLTSLEGKRLLGTGQWSPAASRDDDVLYRVGSASQGFLWHTLAYARGPLWEPRGFMEHILDFLQKIYAALNNDAVKVLFASEGGFDFELILDEPTSSPVSMALAADSDAAIIAYTCNENLTFGYSDVCYQLGTQSGRAFETAVHTVSRIPADAATCDQSNPNPEFRALTYAGPAAAYDPGTKSFILAWPNLIGDIEVITVPTAASATPATCARLANRTDDAPSIACRIVAPQSFPGFPRCLIAYKDRAFGQPPCLRWIDSAIDATTGELVVGATHRQCFIQYDTPSIAWDRTQDRFTLAFHQENGTIFSRTLASQALFPVPKWLAGPDIASGAGGYHSAPSLSTDFSCGFGTCRGSVHAWYLRYPNPNVPIPGPGPEPVTRFPSAPGELAALLGDGLDAGDVRCIYDLQESGPPAVPSGAGCPRLTPGIPPAFARPCGGLRLPDERCLLFDQADQVLIADDSTAFDVPDSGQLTLLVVWRAAAAMQVGDTADILAKQNLTSPFYGWNLHVSDFGGVGVFIGRPADGSATPLGTSLVTVAAYDDLRPHVFALVLDRDADTMRLLTELESLGPAPLSDIISQHSAEPMRLGRTFADSEFVRRVATGEVAYLAIFDAALTPSQIRHFWSLAE